MAKLKNILLKSVLAAVSLFWLNACFKEPQYSNIPEIIFNRFDLSSNPYNYLDSSGLLVVDFTDGDGDLDLVQLNDSTFSSAKIFFVLNEYDSLRNYVIDELMFPKFNLSSGTVVHTGYFSINLTAIFTETLYPSLQPKLPGMTKDTVTIKMWLKDRAGNTSNVINTPPLIIKYQ